MERARPGPITTWPFYPLAFTLALVLTIFNNAVSATAVLPRPLVIALIVTLGLQAVVSMIVRERHLGAYLSLVILLALAGWYQFAVVFAAAPVAIVVAGLIVRRVAPPIPWSRATEYLNILGAILVVMTVYSAWSSGALRPAVGARDGEQLGGVGPDVYLILLDGYPRADTLLADFGFDNSPFLREMEEIGFDVADRAHSNYPHTSLTLASMLHMKQVPSIDALRTWQGRQQDEDRQVSRAINAGAGVAAFRELGYEIVSVPSPWSAVTMYSADRVLDDGAINDLELSVLKQGLIPFLFPGFQRSWITDSLRTRILSSIDLTTDLAGERGGPPKLVLTHLLSPHAPVLFGSDGSPRYGWDCLPHCSPFDSGWGYGNAVLEPTVGQIEYLNSQVVRMVRSIIDASSEPPVIVVFSDHGHRHHLEDRAEMFRSLLLSYTPGHQGLFPDDASPVNLLSRLLNAYHDAGIPLSSEEKYWVDLVVYRFETMSRFD